MRVWSFLYGNEHTPLFIYLCLCKTNHKRKSYLKDYANTVSITRLGLNDHGPVHMRTVCYNALKMLRILHDAGMTIGRKDHELYSGIISCQIITDILQKIIPARW